MLIFLFFSQKRIRVGPLASLALVLVVLRVYQRRFRLFFDFLSNFGFLSFFSIFESLAASEIEQVASKHEKIRCFLPFYQNSAFYHF